ncbi:MAG: 50S ribosomal protein L4 [Bacilli bacterium]|jgi:large subunit ribosomal protein L4
MPKIALLNITGEKIKEIDLTADIWGIEPNKVVLHEAVVLAKASLRQGTSKTKTRGEVQGGGRKPWRQKGTGRARHGSIRSPIWVGGGVVFGPQPRSYSKKMNKKERRLALKSALSLKVTDQELIVLDDFLIESPKTKRILEILKALKIEKSVLIVTNDLKENLILSSRNLDYIKVIEPHEINVLDVMSYHYLLITEESLKKIEEVLL